MKEIVSYVYGSFNDYLGREHKVIVCGITQTVNSGEICTLGYNENDYEEYFSVQKVLTIGVSICNPADEYDQDKGEAIAYNRAKDFDTAIILTSSRRGMFNTATVNFMLNDYLTYIERDPGSVLKGYDKAKKSYQERMDLLDDINKMSENELNFVKAMAKVTQEQLDYARKITKLLNS